MSPRLASVLLVPAVLLPGCGLYPYKAKADRVVEVDHVPDAAVIRLRFFRSMNYVMRQFFGRNYQQDMCSLANAIANKKRGVPSASSRRSSHAS